jgi:hypothetical protein
MYLYNNQHSALIGTLFCVFALCVLGLHTAHHQEATCTMWQMVFVSCEKEKNLKLLKFFYYTLM